MSDNNNTQAMGKESFAPETHISSFIGQLNTKVQAVVSHFINERGGAEITDKDLQGLAAKITNTISIATIGQVDITPTTDLPIFVQVPEFIAGRLGNAEEISQLESAIDNMLSAVENDPQFDSKYDYDGVARSLNWVIDAAQHALKSRESGFDPTTPTAPLAEPATSAEKPSTKVDPTDGMRPHQRERYLKLQLPANVFHLSSPEHRESVTIVSDSSFFNTITGKEFSGEMFRQISAWYAAFASTDDDTRDSLFVDYKKSGIYFCEIMDFLTALIPEIALKEWRVGSDSMSQVISTEITKAAEGWRKIVDSYKDMVDGYENTCRMAVESVELRDAEIQRLRDLYEPTTPATELMEGGAGI